MIVRIVYLDQNKWIELARAAKHPSDYTDLQPVLKTVIDEVGAGRLALPLTSTNIYETHKINDAQRRYELASLQATLSQGRVFRGRYKRLEAEIGNVVRVACGLPSISRAGHWYLSDVFFEAFAEWTTAAFHRYQRVWSL
jgi:hypothetical protein